MKISKEILDNIVEQLGDGGYNDDGCNCATYEDAEKDIYIEASVQWLISYSENWITFEGRSYYECTYTDVYGWDDLEVDAWIGEEKAEVDMDYIEKNLY